MPVTAALVSYRPEQFSWLFVDSFLGWKYIGGGGRGANCYDELCYEKCVSPLVLTQSLTVECLDALFIVVLIFDILLWHFVRR